MASEGKEEETSPIYEARIKQQNQSLEGLENRTSSGVGSLVFVL